MCIRDRPNSFDFKLMMNEIDKMKRILLEQQDQIKYLTENLSVEKNKNYNLKLDMEAQRAENFKLEASNGKLENRLNRLEMITNDLRKNTYSMTASPSISPIRKNNIPGSWATEPADSQRYSQSLFSSKPNSRSTYDVNGINRQPSWMNRPTGGSYRTSSNTFPRTRPFLDSYYPRNDNIRIDNPREESTEALLAKLP